MKITGIILAVLLLMLPAPVRATTYYVDSVAGADTHSGTSPANAWRSLEKVNATTFQAGDRLLFNAGNTWTGQLHPRGSGNAEHRIEIDRYGNGPRPVIHGGGIQGGAVLLENQQYWNIHNLEITNQGTSTPKKMGILIRNCSVGTLSGFEVRGCFIHNVAGDMTEYRDGKESGGIVFYITAANLSVTSRWTNVRVVDNTIQDVARSGILMQSLWINKPEQPNSNWKGHGPYTTSTDIAITSNRLERIGGDGIILWCARGAIVERNFVSQSNNNTLKQGHAAVWPYFCEDVVFQYNEVCGTKTRHDGMAFDFDNSNLRCIYQYNYSHDNEGGFLNMCTDGLSSGNIARYNISQNDGCTALSRVFLVHGDGNRDCQVYNNTIYVKNGNPALFQQGADSSKSSILFRNNIFINAGTGAFVAPKGCSFDRNIYSGSGRIDKDARGLLADPCLVAAGSGLQGSASLAGYKLRAGSPALKSGVVIPGSGGSDFWGNPVPGKEAPNLGAFNGDPEKSAVIQK